MTIGISKHVYCIHAHIVSNILEYKENTSCSEAVENTFTIHFYRTEIQNKTKEYENLFSIQLSVTNT